MLNKDILKKHISNAITTIVCKGIKRAMLTIQPVQSDAGNNAAERFANTFSETVSDSFAEVIASAIDYYVKNIEIYGTVVTIGSSVSQTAKINSGSIPQVNGYVPNTLGIR